ncbi:MAG: hypothetical protein K2H61_02825, partial [Muribaculaceae bacterium]|nr:hypothetical protein [Muribaculaceae bacterium]
MASNASTEWLYNQLTNKGYNVGKDQAEFDSLMLNNADSRQWAYNTAKGLGLNVGENLDEFTSLVAPSQAATGSGWWQGVNDVVANVGNMAAAAASGQA